MISRTRLPLLLLTCMGLAAAAWAQPATQPAAPQLPALSAAAPIKPAADWPGWRGPYRNGTAASARKWATTWPAEGPKKLWTVKLGDGYSSPVIAGGKVFIAGLGDPKKGGKSKADTLYCLNADIGEIIWQKTLPDNGTNTNWPTCSTPQVDDQVIYAVTDSCAVGAYDSQTGDELWTRDLLKEGAKPLPSRPWAAAPLVEGNLLIFNGCTAGLALDKSTGKVAWKSDPAFAPYVSPVPFDLDGRRLVLMMTEPSVLAVNPGDGTVAFSATRKQISAKLLENETFTDPVVRGRDIEFAGLWMHPQDGKIVFDPEGSRQRNYTPAVTCQPIIYQGCIYGAHIIEPHGGLTKLLQYGYRCRDWTTGQVKWEQAGVTGMNILVDDKLLILNIDGQFIIAQATPEKYVELARTPVFPGYKDGVKETHCLVAPSFADGRVYLRKGDTVVCLDLRQE
jgi:outer membrane protein assembly factor BamB